MAGEGERSLFLPSSSTQRKCGESEKLSLFDRQANIGCQFSL
jgi:hypothetical protein